ncbi:MAG TPA: flagellar protein FliT [Rhodopila sp.]
MMPTPAPVLDIYKSIARITGAMLVAAQADDWAKVVHYGQEYCETVERLRNIEPNEPPLDSSARSIKYDLLVQILDNDAAVRDLAMPQLKNLSHMLGRMRRQQSLLLAYQGRTHSL